MLALLKLVPLKDWIYLSLIVVLLAAFGYYTIHERHVGEQKIEAADAKVAAIQQKHDEDVQNASKTAADNALDAYKASELQPVALPSTRIVCHAAGSSAVPRAPSPSAGGNAAPADGSKDQTEFDPSTGALEAGRDADAQIKLLQDLVRSYQAAGAVAK